MVDITSEKIEGTLKKDRPVLIVAAIACVLAFSGICAIKIDYELNGGYNKFLFLITGLAAVFICGLAVWKVSQSPLLGNSKITQEAREYLRRDFTSDKAVRQLFDKLSRAGNNADKTMLTLLLCDVYMYRGQADKAISLLDNTDRGRFAEYPFIGVYFYERVIGIYSDLQDNESVLAAYKDAEALVDECALKCYGCCQAAIGIYIAVEKALGNYRKALDMLLMKTEFNSRPYVSSKEIYPMKQFLDGLNLYRTAELYYLCGDIENAARALDKGGEMLSPSRFYLNMANELSAKLVQEINK